MGRLYRRPNSPYWWARWQDPDGITRRQSTRSGSRAVAALFLAARESEVIRAHAGIPTAASIPLAAAVAQYLAAHQPPVWSARWWDTVNRWWHLRLIDDLGGPDAIVSKVTREQVEDLPQRWLAGSDEVRKLKPATVNRLLAIGSGFYRWALGKGMALENPFKGVRRFHEDRRDVPPMPEAALATLLAGFTSPVVRLAATVTVDTGLRRSELERARVEDLRGTDLLVASGYERGHTKTKEPRLVPLTPRALKAIREQVGKRKEGPIFGTLPDYRHQMRQACLGAGLRTLRWHDLRHVALTRAAHAGALGHDLKYLAGWKSLAMADRYVHPDKARVRAVMDRVGRCAPGVQAPSGKKRQKRKKKAEKRHTKRLSAET